MIIYSQNYKYFLVDQTNIGEKQQQREKKKQNNESDHDDST